MGNKDMRLMTLLRDDPTLVSRIQQIKKEVERDTEKIKNISDEYNRRFKKEIVAGTAKKHLMLEEGKRRGQSIEEIEMSHGFIPSVYTPILNWLFFFLMEGQDFGKEILREELDETYRILLHDDEEIESADNVPDMTTYIYGNITLEKFQTLKKLKRLSKSPNEHEAFSAYRKCMELCRDYGIEFDKIPS